MKVKPLPMLAGMLMFALAFAPFAAEACSGRKTTDANSGTTSQPTQQGTTRT
ncbi:MAG: hypothetical protein MUD14_06390 [Hydrococcus sp. Prado102]|nr:hypothetical protein [Hydrococcus sp. Prado102]